MFSFHKPKVYRSINGCCICCAKSSSSRFTDSSKYEEDFYKCFRIMEPRQGEICNACVLLVKRWQKLPPGSTRNWHHVVDARAGPGSKSIAKIKHKAEQALNQKKQKFVKSSAERAIQNANRHNREQCAQKGIEDLHIKKTRSSAYAPPPSPTFSDNSDEADVPARRLLPRNKISPFLDLTYWKCTKVCCGYIFKGPTGEVIVDPNLLEPCAAHKKANGEKSAPNRTNDDRCHGQSHSDGESYHSSESPDFHEDAAAEPMEHCPVVEPEDEETDIEEDLDDALEDVEEDGLMEDGFADEDDDDDL